MIRMNKLIVSTSTTIQKRYIVRPIPIPIPIPIDKVKTKTYGRSYYTSSLSLVVVPSKSKPLSCYTSSNNNNNRNHHDIRRIDYIILSNKKLFSSLANVKEEIHHDHDDSDEKENNKIPRSPTQRNYKKKTSNNNRLHQLREQLSIDQHVNISDYKLKKQENNNVNVMKQNSKIKSSNNSSKVISGNDDNDDDDDDANYELPKNVQKIVTKLRAQKQKQQQSQINNKESNSSNSMLTDSYKRMHNYLRISLIERCNLRCQYCMPEEGTTLQPKNKLLSTSELKKLVSLFIQSGVNKVRLTGGEPLLRKDISDIISYINTYDSINSIGITTNGITLSKQLPKLIESGLTHVNISLDTLSSDKFINITRRKGYNKVIQSIKDSMHLLQPNNERRVKVNSVVMRNVNDDEIINFCNLLQDDIDVAHKPLDIRFIEWMPFYNNKWNADRLVTYKQMVDKIEDYYGRPLIRLQDSPNDTTKWYALPNNNTSSSSSDHTNNNPLRRIGFITSMSNHFCSSCNRLRITADGQLKVCLFGDQEINLRSIIRKNGYTMNEDDNDDELRLIIEASVKSKYYSLGGYSSGEDIAKNSTNRAMTLIGG